MPARRSERAAPWVLLVIVVALWELLCRGLGISEFIFPAPSAIASVREATRMGDGFGVVETISRLVSKPASSARTSTRESSRPQSHSRSRSRSRSPPGWHASTSAATDMAMLVTVHLQDADGIDARFELGPRTARSRPAHDHDYFHARQGQP